MAENQSTVFRKKTLDRISSPEQLTDYLRVTNPGIWVALVASVNTDEYGRSIGTAEIELPDGTYPGIVVVEQTHPIDFLLKSK